MVSLPFDTDAPPEQPPPCCADPLLWRVARALYEEHRWEPGGRCLCGDRYPCSRARLAERGLVTSCTRRRQGLARPGGVQPAVGSAGASVLAQPG
jgi:hypothetical protein